MSDTTIIHALAETVNPANGSLSIRINIPLPSSRGFTMPFSIAYDSNGVYYLQGVCNGCNGIDWGTAATMLASGGWSYTVPMLSVQSDVFSVPYTTPLGDEATFVCQGRDNYVMQEPTGERRNLGLAYYNPNPHCQGGNDAIGPLNRVA